MYKTGSKLAQAKMVRDIHLKSDHSYDQVEESERYRLLKQKKRNLEDILFNMPKDHPSYKGYAKEVSLVNEQINEIKPKKPKRMNFWYTLAMCLKEHDPSLFIEIEKKANQRHQQLLRR